MSSFSEIINKDKPVLIDFHAEWCGPCKVMGPVLEKVKDLLGEAVSIIKIDVDKNQKLAASLNVRGVPTFMLYHKGKQLWRKSGIISKEELVERISKLNFLTK